MWLGVCCGRLCTQVSGVQPRGQGEYTRRRWTLHHRLHEDADVSTRRPGSGNLIITKFCIFNLACLPAALC